MEEKLVTTVILWTGTDVLQPAQLNLTQIVFWCLTQILTFAMFVEITNEKDQSFVTMEID